MRCSLKNGKNRRRSNSDCQKKRQESVIINEFATHMNPCHAVYAQRVRPFNKLSRKNGKADTFEINFIFGYRTFDIECNYMTNV